MEARDIEWGQKLEVSLWGECVAQSSCVIASVRVCVRACACVCVHVCVLAEGRQAVCLTVGNPHAIDLGLN